MASASDLQPIDMSTLPGYVSTTPSSGIGGLLTDVVGGIFDNFGEVASGVGGMAAINAAYNRLGSIGDQALEGANVIAGQGLTQSQFQPFTVKTGMGGSAAVDQFGGIDLSSGRGDEIGGTLLSNAAQRFGTTPTGVSALGGAGTQAVDLSRDFMRGAGMSTADREQDIYGRIRAMQKPEEERQRLALEERLASQGRLGVRTNMYGGTPEQLVLAKAQEEAQDRAALLAMQQAQQEQRQAADIGATYGQLGSNILANRLGLQEAQQRLGLGALTGAYIPQAQTLNALQQGLAASQLAQRGQLYGAGLFGEASMGGLEALLASGLGQANLMGNVGTGLLAGSMGSASSDSGGDGLFSIIGDAGSGLLDILGLG